MEYTNDSESEAIRFLKGLENTYWCRHCRQGLFFYHDCPLSLGFKIPSIFFNMTTPTTCSVNPYPRYLQHRMRDNRLVNTFRQAYPEACGKENPTRYCYEKFHHDFTL
jgi:hypothetical protein